MVDKDDKLEEAVPVQDWNNPGIEAPAVAGPVLRARPDTITEGGEVVLVVTRLPGSPEDYCYRWSVDSGKVKMRDTPWVAAWDTTGLLASSYEARVRIYNISRENTFDISGGDALIAELDKGIVPDDINNALTEHREVSLESPVVWIQHKGSIWLITHQGDEAYTVKKNDDRLEICESDEVHSLTTRITVEMRPLSKDDTIAVTMKRAALQQTADQALWVVIRNSTDAISFGNYKSFIDDIMCGGDLSQPVKILPFPRVDAYSLLKTATEVFLMGSCGVAIDFSKLDITEERIRFGRDIEPGEIEDLWNEYLIEAKGVETLPYLESIIETKLKELPIKDENATRCYGILQEKLSNPCLLELIWSYWLEESMLVQTMKAISLRFQNKRAMADRDPLARLDVDPLRPLNNMLWGYIQDEQHRLNIPRRSYEYDHHYGLMLYGKVVPKLRPADSRSKFLEAFHNLLHLCYIFYQSDDDTTVIADAFPMLNSLKEVHMLLAQGAHNLYGDLPWVARMEMMMEQWLLARPEMREFLGGRIMVPYPEGWMDRVDNVKKLCGWTDTTVTHFYYLAVFGERILLSIRYGNWIEINDRLHAANWARYWRAEIQGYMQNYRAVTGVDLTAELASGRVDSTMPSVHLRKRLAMQAQRA